MPRRMVIIRNDDSAPILQEHQAHNEPQLQNRMKRNPELLPLDEFDLTGPPIVVGRETTLASGAIDLLLLARGGEVVVVEFKTGPQNPDFRAALGQLLDYGSDLWGLDYERFEREVARRYFMSHHAQDSAVKGCQTLLEAASVIWADAPLSQEELVLFQDRIRSGLADGAFHYVVVAQRFTPAMERTAQYLNATMPRASFYLVEMVRFTGDGLEAFECRTVLKPPVSRRPPPGQSLTEETFLDRLDDAAYHDALLRLFDAARSLGLSLQWGTSSMSIRFRGPGQKTPVSIGWLVPPGEVGWMGLTELTLGFDPSSSATAELLDCLTGYLDCVGTLPGAKVVTKAGMKAVTLAPVHTVASTEAVVACLERLVQAAAER